MSKPKPPKRAPKTIKERKWLKEYIKSGNGTQSAMKIYNCNNEKTASVIGSENLAKLSIENAMRAEGISDHALVETLKDGLLASKGFRIKVSKDKFEIKHEPDHPTRHKYLETGLRLKGHGPNAKIDVNVVNLIAIPKEDNLVPPPRPADESVKA